MNLGILARRYAETIRSAILHDGPLVAGRLKPIMLGSTRTFNVLTKVGREIGRLKIEDRGRFRDLDETEIAQLLHAVGQTLGLDDPSEFRPFIDADEVGAEATRRLFEAMGFVTSTPTGPVIPTVHFGIGSEP